MNAKWISNACIVAATGLIAVCVYQLTDEWRRPSIAKIRFDLAVPADAAAQQEYVVPLQIRNDNRRAIKILGEYTC